MVTKEQAMTATEFHANGCTLTIGKRGAQRESVTRFRRNGATKTWKRNSNRFLVPVKHGMYGPYEHITESNAKHFHIADECQQYRATVKLTGKVNV